MTTALTFDLGYDQLLRRWETSVDQLELSDEFGSTHVNACGPADGSPVVLLAGHGATSPVWFAVAPRLAERYRVYAVDLIGDAGRSRNSGRRPKKPSDLHNWLSNVLDGLSLTRTALCGHSYGSWIALTYCLAHPDRVDRLALLDPTDCFLGLRPSYVVRALPSLLRPTRKRTESFLRWETQGTPVDEGWLELAGLAAVEPTSPFVRTKRPTDDELRSLRPAPLVFVAGRSKSQDPDRLVQRVRTLVPAARVVRLATATHHSLPVTHADELVAGLTAYVACR